MAKPSRNLSLLRSISSQGFQIMASGIDMTLDDLIKKNKQSKPSRGRGRSCAPGPTRRIFKRRANRSGPYSSSNVEAPEGMWQHDMFANHAAAYPALAARASAMETGTKLYVSNLDYGVSNEDIKELFSEGTADVVFAQKVDALAAVKRYNNVQLDGKPMIIEVVGTNIPTPVAAPASMGMNGNQNGALRSSQGRARAMGQSRGAAHGARRGWGQGRGIGQKVSAEDLDAELEEYHAEAMETS